MNKFTKSLVVLVSLITVACGSDAGSQPGVATTDYQVCGNYDKDWDLACESGVQTDVIVNIDAVQQRYHVYCLPEGSTYIGQREINGSAREVENQVLLADGTYENISYFPVLCLPEDGNTDGAFWVTEGDKVF